MGFDNPWGFAWMSAWAVIVLLYLFRRKARREVVSALFLWERIPPSAPPHRRRRRFLWEREIILQLLAVALLAVAMSNPFLSRERGWEEVAIIIDGSASMGAWGRAEEARAIARGIARDSSGPWTVILWADPPRYLAPPTHDLGEVLKGIENYAPTYGSRPPLDRALALVPGSWGRIVVVTDTPLEGVETVVLPPVPDFALTAFSIRPEPDGSGYSAFVAVYNGTKEEASIPVAVEVGELSFREVLHVAPGETAHLSFPYFGPLERGLVARIETTDGFPWNDVRYFSFGETDALRVRWVGEEDRYLKAALSAAGYLRITDSPPWDLTVAVRTELDSIDGPTLLWESGAPGIELGESVREGKWAAQDGFLARYLSFERWEKVGVRAEAVPEGAKVLLARGEIPAVWIQRNRGHPVAVAALDLSDAKEVVISPDFPLLVRRLLVPLVKPPGRRTYEVGDPVELSRGEDTLWVPDAPGLYEITSDRGTYVVAVNLPEDELLPTGGEETLSPRSSAHSGAPAKLRIWRHWAWALFGVLVFEALLRFKRW